jgi:hypothetical protein
MLFKLTDVSSPVVASADLRINRSVVSNILNYK